MRDSETPLETVLSFVKEGMSAAICNDGNIHDYKHEAKRIPKSENNIGVPIVIFNYVGCAYLVLIPAWHANTLTMKDTEDMDNIAIAALSG